TYGPFMTVFDLRTRTLASKIPVPGGTQGVAVSPDGTQVVVMATTEPTALVIDPTTHTDVDRLTLANQKAGGYKAYFSPDGKYLVTMNLGSASINIFDAANLRGMQHTLTVGKDPMGFAFSADGKTVLVANHGDGSVSVVDLSSKQGTGLFQAGTGIETLTYYYHARAKTPGLAHFHFRCARG